MAQDVRSVSQVTEYITARLTGDPSLKNLAVRGEISNISITAATGHCYFSIKDERSVLRCALFRGYASRVKFKLERGMKVIVVGEISVYSKDSGYQLKCFNVVPDGVGSLHIAFEQLKQKLAAKGLFDPAHHKPLPKFPGTIGIITSPSGAAVHDMLRILNKRFPLSKVRIIPARVQGEEAPSEIAAAIGYANRYALADVLIVGRGGGSIEDLWAFNEEIVAYAIYHSKIPVISAVGHEPDFTIADFVADIRAATPSNAAEIVVPDQDHLRRDMDSMYARITSMLNRQLKAARKHYEVLASSPALRSPLGYMEQRRRVLELLRNRMVSAQNQSIQRRKQRYIASVAKLDAMSPLKVLTRGYAMAQTEQGQVIRSVEQVNTGDRIHIAVSNGSLTATVDDVKENVQ